MSEQTDPAGWISVNDRLPEDDLPVMVYTPARDGEEERIDFEFRYEGCWYHHNDSYDHYMAVGGPNAVPGELCTGPDAEAPYTHWMPLPPPPVSPTPNSMEDENNSRLMNADKNAAAGVQGLDELSRLRAFFSEVAALTVEHDALTDHTGEDHAVVFPSKLSKALGKVDPNWHGWCSAAMELPDGDRDEQ
jgi:hypothetical protein